MDRPRTSARPEIGAWISAAGSNPRTVSRSIGEIASRKSLGQALGRSRDVERGPMQRVDGGFHGGILDVVKDHRVGLQTFGRCGWIWTQAPMELERR